MRPNKCRSALFLALNLPPSLRITDSKSRVPLISRPPRVARSHKLPGPLLPTSNPQAHPSLVLPLRPGKDPRCGRCHISQIQQPGSMRDKGASCQLTRFDASARRRLPPPIRDADEDPDASGPRWARRHHGNGRRDDISDPVADPVGTDCEWRNLLADRPASTANSGRNGSHFCRPSNPSTASTVRTSRGRELDALRRLLCGRVFYGDRPVLPRVPERWWRHVHLPKYPRW